MKSLWKIARRPLLAVGCCSVLALSASCESFLDPKPNDVLATENFYHSAEDAVAAVNAVYAQALWVYFWNWYQSDISTDDVLATANFGTDGHQLASYTFDPTLWSIDNTWSNAYMTINRANIVLDRVPGITMDSVQRNRVLGEAHYLRAMLYFDLVRMFGNVPLMQHEVKSVPDAQVPQSPVADVYNLIIQDLQTAAQQLPASYSGNDIGRATSGAATALLAKVYLTQKDWTNAAKYAGQVMASGNYALNANWSDNFRVALKNINPESIFEIQYASQDQVPWMGSVMTLFTLPSGYPGGDAYGLMRVAPDLVALYSPQDKRGNGATYFTSPYTDALGRTVTWGVPNGPAFHKWLDETSQQNMTARVWQQQPNNWIILRYADVLLMYAEAVNEGGAATAGPAVSALNQVRQRAGITPLAALSQGALRDSIRVERRREFAFEGQRWFDLSRWGILDQTIRAKTQMMQTVQPGETTVHGVKSNLFPIPQGQLNQNPKLVQNSGW